ncbi:MAG: Gfo/Idh/MocA family oxidoreductase [Ilumatobacteraceae bacterium]
MGCGAISREHLSALAENPRAELVGVVDLSRAARSYAADRYGARAHYATIEALLDEAHPEVVHVLTPPWTHRDLALQCLRAGAHVICEKPITESLVDLHLILDEAASQDLLVIESQNYRFNDDVVRILEMVAAGELGDVLEAEVRSSWTSRAVGSSAIRTSRARRPG